MPHAPQRERPGGAAPADEVTPPALLVWLLVWLLVGLLVGVLPESSAPGICPVPAQATEVVIVPV